MMYVLCCYLGTLFRLLFLCYLCSCLLVVLVRLSVPVHASDWLERLVSEMTYNVLMGTLNSTHSEYNMVVLQCCYWCYLQRWKALCCEDYPQDVWLLRIGKNWSQCTGEVERARSSWRTVSSVLLVMCFKFNVHVCFDISLFLVLCGLWGWKNRPRSVSWPDVVKADQTRLYLSCLLA